MGQRHQLFVIATINARYHGLAVIHNQWLYGGLSLRRCLALLKIFQVEENCIAIQQELIAAQRCEETFWTSGLDNVFIVRHTDSPDAFGHRTYISE